MAIERELTCPRQAECAHPATVAVGKDGRCATCGAQVTLPTCVRHGSSRGAYMWTQAEYDGALS